MEVFSNRLSAALVALLVLTCGSAFGGVSLVAQTDEVQISGSASVLGGATAPPFSQSQTATVNLPFNVSLQNNLTVSDTVFAGATASQNSLLSVGSQSLSLTATGKGSAGALAIGGEASANSLSGYYVVFSVDAPTPYTLTESTDQEGYNDNNDIDVGASLYAGQQSNGVGGVPGLNSLVPELIAVRFFGGGNQTFSGTLDPGTYTLEGGFAAGGSAPGVEGSGSYSIDFSVGTPANGGGSGSGGTTAVPLPAAFWPAAAVLGLIWLVLANARRRSRLVR